MHISILTLLIRKVTWDIEENKYWWNEALQNHLALSKDLGKETLDRTENKNKLLKKKKKKKQIIVDINKIN